MTSELLMELEDIGLRYNGNSILDVERLDVRRDETLAILGPTGSGKSTLLRVMNLLEWPERGVIRWRGETIEGKRVDLGIRRRMAMAFQAPLLLRATVFNNIAYGLKVRHLTRDEIREKVKSVLDLFGIGQLAERPASDISGGEAQRAALARAMVVNPELLLLDEPLASLDPTTKDGLMSDLKRILKSVNVACVYVTHSRQEAFVMADRVAVLVNGRIEQVGTPEEVFYRPQSQDVAEFVGTENLIDGRIKVQDNGLATIVFDGGSIEAVTDHPEGAWVTACVRPEEVILESAPGGLGSTVSARNRFSARIKDLVVLGAVAKVALDCGFPLVATVTRRSLKDLNLKAGKNVRAGFKATSVHVILRKRS